MSEVLKPCPFCGGKAVIDDCSDVLAGGSFYAMCEDCGAEIWAGTPEDATEAWNQRVEVKPCGEE